MGEKKVREEVGSGRAMRVWQRMEDGGHERPGGGCEGRGRWSERDQGAGARCMTEEESRRCLGCLWKDLGNENRRRAHLS
jgi:hypothetical protein